MDKKYSYTDAVLKAIEQDRDKFEQMLISIAETPFQNEHGDVWVTKGLSLAVCAELTEMCFHQKMTDDFDFKTLAHDESDELLGIYQ